MSIELNEDNYADTITETGGVAVVQFTAPWCGPCRMLAPRLEELAAEEGITYYKVDVDQNSELARDFQIMSVPTLRFYKDGRFVKSLVGAKPKKELLEELEDLN